MPINLPSNQIKLTNVAIVRLKKGKKRYELACYKNKVLEYRSGVETDLDEVLQIHQVFTNVSKGAVAPHSDLTKSFPSTPLTSIILEILQKGELQVGEKERTAHLEQIHAEVVQLVASMCVDPVSKRVYTASMIEKALQELSSRPANGEEDGVPGWHGVAEKKSAKAQALEAIKALVYHQPVPIARARMRLRIVGPKRIKEAVIGMVEEVEEESFEGANWECTGFVEPGRYKGLVDLVGGQTKGKGRVEVLDTAVVSGGGS